MKRLGLKLETRAACTHPGRWWMFPVAGLGHAALMALAFPPLSVWPVIFIAIVPLVWAGCHAGKRPLVSGALTGLGVLPLWLYMEYWLVNVTLPGYPGLAGYMTMYSVLCVWMLGMARRVDWGVPMSLVVAIVWTGLEFLRSDVVLTGYGFYLLGHPLIEVAALAAPAAVLGAHAVSFLIACLAGSLADSAGWGGISRRAGGVSCGVCVLVWAVLSVVGLRSLAGPGGGSGESFEFRVGVVQTNVPQDNKMSWSFPQKLADFAKFAELSRQAGAAKPGPDVIVWPETMFPGYVLNESGLKAEREAVLVYKVDEKVHPSGKLPSTVFADELVKLQGELRTTMVVGALASEGLKFEADEKGYVKPTQEARHNSVFVLSDGKVSPERYDKIDLTPFGEVIPYVWRWPELQQAVIDFGAKGMGFDLKSGVREEPLLIGLRSQDGDGRPASVRVATPICFEVTRGGLCRRLVEGRGGDGAQVLMNLSNDGWFTSFDAGREAHFLASRWRCVELGLPMVRAVNTGRSAIIDRYGQVVGEAGVSPGLRKEGVLSGTVRLDRHPGRTIFRLVGQAAWVGVSGAMLVMCGAMVWRRRTLRRSGR